MSLKDSEYLKLEEEGQYSIEVYPGKNYIQFNFYGELKKSEDIAHYVEHVAKALEKINDGYTVLSYATTKKTPGFSTTAVFKAGLKLMEARNMSRVAFVSGTGNILHKMVINVLSKLTKLEIKVFDEIDDAQLWLGVND